MTICTLRNIHTGCDMQYKFDFIPRIGDKIEISEMDLCDNKEWQDFAGADESDPNFESHGFRSYEVCAVHHLINPNEFTSVEIFVDEFNGDDPNNL